MIENVEEKELEEAFKKRNREELKIVDTLNLLNEKVLNKYYPELKICKEEELCINDLFKAHFNSIEKFENEKEGKFESIIAIAVFRALFIGKFGGFNIKDLDKKICSFNLVIKLLLQDILDDNDNKAIEEMRKYELFEEIAKENDCDYYYSYCLFLILEYSELKIFFVDAFISFMKKSYKEEGKNLEIVKDESISEDNLKSMNSFDLVKSLKDIYSKGDTLYVLEFDQGQHLIKEKTISTDEVLKIINKNNEQEAKKKKRKKNKKNKKKAKENNNIEKINNQEINNIQSESHEERKLQEENNIQDENEKKKERKEQKEIKEKDEKEEKKERKEPKEIKEKDEKEEKKERKEPKEIKDKDEKEEKKERKEPKEIKDKDEKKKKERKEQYEIKEKDEKVEKKEREEQKESDDPNELLSLVKSLKIELKGVIKKYEKKNDELSGKINEYEKKNDELSGKINEYEKKNDELSGKINKYEKKNDELSGKINEYEKKNEELSGEINEYKKKNEELSGKVEEMEMKIKKNKKAIKSIKSENVKMMEDLVSVKKELKLIQLRDVVKNIIDLFCKAYKIILDISYADKVKEIKKKIPLTVAKENELELRNFFDKIYLNFVHSNMIAHSVDITASIIEQLFNQIDDKGNFKNVKEKLLKGKIDILLNKLGVQRNLYFKDKAKLRVEEEKIIDSVQHLTDIYQ